MTMTHQPAAVELVDLLEEWTRAGLISPAQAAALDRDAHRRVVLAGPTGPPSGRGARSVALEGLGYLGAAIVVAAGVTLAAQYWGLFESLVRHQLLEYAARGGTGQRP